MRVILSLGLITFLLLLSASASKAQEDVGLIELHVEALAGGVTVTLPAASEWSVGVDLSVGKHLGADLIEVDDELDLVGGGYAVVSWRPTSSLQVSLGPIGLAGVIGNDFGAIYPSARLGVGHFWERVGIGTEFRLVRIAGGFGTGNYWVHWSPVRLSLRL